MFLCSRSDVWQGGRLEGDRVFNPESTGSSLVRDSYCVGTLSKFFAHNALKCQGICSTEACKCTSELPVKRVISKLSCIVLYYCIDVRVGESWLICLQAHESKISGKVTTCGFIQQAFWTQPRLPSRVDTMLPVHATLRLMTTKLPRNSWHCSQLITNWTVERFFNITNIKLLPMHHDVFRLMTFPLMLSSTLVHDKTLPWMAKHPSEPTRAIRAISSASKA